MNTETEYLLTKYNDKTQQLIHLHFATEPELKGHLKAMWEFTDFHLISIALVPADCKPYSLFQTKTVQETT